MIFCACVVTLNARAADPAVIARGEYLARAGDCIACHTVPAGKLFGGGRAMETPFGTLYTPNISSDKETGIGKWTSGEFYTMMHTGKSRDGELLYPAMPFASYTKVTRTDSTRSTRTCCPRRPFISLIARMNCDFRSTSAHCCTDGACCT
jgi:hypothetical protein